MTANPSQKCSGNRPLPVDRVGHEEPSNEASERIHRWVVQAPVWQSLAVSLSSKVTLQQGAPDARGQPQLDVVNTCDKAVGTPRAGTAIDSISPHVHNSLCCGEVCLCSEVWIKDVLMDGATA